MCAPAAAAAAPAMRRDAEAVLDRTRPRIARHVTPLPAERLRAHAEVLAPCLRQVRFGKILDAELDGIHAHAVREFVHQDFRQEAALRMSRCAHRALLTGVDVDVGMDSAPVREVIDVGQREVRGRARPTGAPALSVECRELAVRALASLALRVRRRTIARVEVFFLPIEEQLDGLSRVLREPRADKALRVRTELAAEPAAHVLRDDANVRCRNPEALRKAVLRAVNTLRAHPR